MKNIVTLALLATALATSAPALIVGFEAGYLTDNEDTYLAVRVGHELKSTDVLSHRLELELGHTEHSETVLLLGAPVTAKSKITPLFLNYRGESIITGKFGYYFGAGLGLARTSFNLPGSGVLNINDSDTSTALQGFAGFSYQPSATATLHLGVKYLWIGDADLAGVSTEVGDDLALTAGVSFKF